MTGLIFIKAAYAGTGSANDFTFSILAIVLFLAFLLGIIILPLAIKRLVNFLMEKYNTNNCPSDNFEVPDDFDYM